MSNVRPAVQRLADGLEVTLHRRDVQSLVARVEVGGVAAGNCAPRPVGRLAPERKCLPTKQPQSVQVTAKRDLVQNP